MLRLREISLCRRRSLLLILFICGLGVRIAIFLTQGPVLWPDSVAYYKFAQGIAEHFDFATHPIFRTPLYPSFLAIFLAFGDSPAVGDTIIGTQLLMGLIASLVFFQLLSQIFSPLHSFFAALLFSLSPLELYYECVIQPEVLFVLLLAVLLLYTWRTLEHPTRSALILNGFVLGLLLLTRPIAQVVFPVMAIAIILGAKRWWDAFGRIATIFCTCCITVLPWMWVNHQTFGFFGLSQEVGLNLFHRTFDMDQYPLPNTFKSLAFDEDFTRHVTKQVNNSRHKGKPSYFHVIHSLRRSGFSWLEADRQMKQLALLTLQNNPGPYLTSALNTLGNYFMSTRTSLAFCQSNDSEHFCAPRGKNIHIRTFSTNKASAWPGLQRIVVSFVKLMWLPASVYGMLGLLGMILTVFSQLICSKPTSTQRAKWYSIILLPFAFAAPVVLFNRAEDRFRLPVEIVLICFSLAVLSWCLKRLISLQQKR